MIRRLIADILPNRVNRKTARRARHDKKRSKGRAPYMEPLELRVLLSTTPTSIVVGSSAYSGVYGQTENLTASVSASPAAPSEGDVSFFNNGNPTPLGTVAVTAGVATLDNVPLPLGTNVITASYSDASGNFASSSTSAASNSTITTYAGGAWGDGMPALAASIHPSSVAVDAAGDVFFTDDGQITGGLYFSDNDQNVVCEIKSGTNTITTVAGNGLFGYSGDNGPGADAEVNNPMSIAVDPAGNYLYIADTDNNVVRRVDLANNDTISTVAGDGVAGYSGDGAQATAAELRGPRGVAVDSSGNLYIADTLNNCIREVNTSGDISTVAGGVVAGYSGDGGKATAAELALPQGIALDSAGDLFIADTANQVVREVNAAGIITTVGGGTYVSDVAVAPSGKLFTTVWGQLGVAIDPAGKYLYDAYSNSIVKVALDGSGSTTTLAGNGAVSFSGDNGALAAAQLNYPSGLTFDSSGNLFIADTGNNRIREVNGGDINTVAGNGGGGYSGDGSSPTVASMNQPGRVAFDSAGDVFIADTLDNRIREVFKSRNTMLTLAGNGTAGYTGDKGPCTAAELDDPRDIVIDSSNDLFIADTGNNVVREVKLTIDPTTGGLTTGTITTYAGNGTAGFSGDGGTATAAELSAPCGLALDSSGDLFIADSGNHVVREVTPGGNITTVAGNGTAGGSGDGGPATAAELSSPDALAVDSSGNLLFIADAGNNRIREINLATGVITTVAGNGSFGIAGPGDAPTDAQLSSPDGLAFDSSGNLLISDTGHNRVLELPAAALAAPAVEVAIAPAPLTITADSKSMFQGAALPARTASYSGFVNGDTPASLTTPPTLSTTATAASAAAGSPYPITVSGAVDPNYTISYVPGTLTVTPGTSISVSASAGSAVYGQAVALTAKVSAWPAPPSEGEVTFVDNGSSLGSASVASGTAVLDNVHLLAGTNVITASYHDTSGNFPDSTTGAGANSIIKTAAGGDDENGVPATGIPLDNGGQQPIAVDAAGDVFIAEADSARVIEVHHGTGTVTVVAGNGSRGFSGDGGLAINAELYYPYALAVDSPDDSSGELFIGDGVDNRVREVNLKTGIITTVAGNGVTGYGGDGGQATNAELDFPGSLVVDSSGDLFIADHANNRVREVNLATGIISTVVGNGAAGNYGNGGPAANVEFGYSFSGGLALDSSGDLFIADGADNNCILELNHATGIVTVLPATVTGAYSPAGLAIDSAGELLFADYNDGSLRKVNLETGAVTTVAGGLWGADSIGVDSLGHVFVESVANNRIYEVDEKTGATTNVLGNGTTTFGGDDDAATAATLNKPFAVAFDSKGNMFIADSANNRVREVNAATGIINTIAGNGSAGYSGDGGAATAAVLSNPTGIAVDSTSDSSGDLVYIADSGNNVIRKVDAAGNISTVVGNGTAGSLNNPQGVAVDAAGDLFIADSGDNRIVELAKGASTISTVVGNGTLATLNDPQGIAVDANGDLFIADSGDNRILELPKGGTSVITVAGDGTAGDSGDGAAATAAELNDPVGIAVDSSGNLFIADKGNNVVREVSASNSDISTVAGNQTARFNGDGGQAVDAELDMPSGVAVNAAGNLFIADSFNNRIRELTGATATVDVAPAALTITANSINKPLGAPLPTRTASYVGFVNGDTAASLTAQPTLTTTATAGSSVVGSPYPINVSGAVDPNYTISYVNGELNVVSPGDLASAGTLAATVGSVFSGTVATFTVAADSQPANQATINWGDGSSATAGTISGPDANGVYTVTGSHTYTSQTTSPGTLSVAATRDGEGTITANDSVNVADAPLAATAQTLAALVNTTLSGTVATFTDPGGAQPLADYSASVDWGDGSGPTAATISGPDVNGVFTVNASHVYTSASQPTATVTLHHDGVTPDVIVNDNVAISAPVTYNSPGGSVTVTLFNGKVEIKAGTSVVSSTPLAEVASVTITAADYTNSAFTLDYSGGVFLVPGGITFNGGALHTTTDNSLTISGGTFGTVTYDFSSAHDGSMTLGTPGNNGPAGQVVNYTNLTPLINTGTVENAVFTLPDGSTVEASLDQGATPGTYQLASANHSFETTTFTAPSGSGGGSGGGGSTGTGSSTGLTGSLTINSGSGSDTVTPTASFYNAFHASLIVKNAVNTLPLHGVGVGTLAAAEDVALTAAVATFQDPNGTGTASDYSATIDWGDGTSASLGSISGPDANGIFTVSGTHTYSAENTAGAAVSVVLHRAGVADTTVTDTADVADAPIYGAPISVTATALATFSGTVATFTDANPAATAGDFTATIDWGDGSSATQGSISGPDAKGVFQVTGSHVYGLDAAEKVVVSIHDVGGAAATVTSAAAITATPHERYVNAVYEDMLGRPADPGALAYWSNLLDQGAPLYAVSEAVAHSAEYYTNTVVESAYERLLGRPADRGGLQYWVAKMEAGLTDRQLEALLIGSDEYYLKAGGTNKAWLDAAYQSILGRAADSSGETYLLALLGDGISRNWVAGYLANSAEANDRRINADYEHYLHRAVDPAALAAITQQIAAGVTNEDVVASLAGSPEYYHEQTSS